MLCGWANRPTLIDWLPIATLLIPKTRRWARFGPYRVLLRRGRSGGSTLLYLGCSDLPMPIYEADTPEAFPPDVHGCQSPAASGPRLARERRETSDSETPILEQWNCLGR